MNPPERILVAVDFSEQAGSLVARALTLARAFEAQLHVAHVRRPVPVPDDLMQRQQQEAAVERDTRARKQIEALMRELDAGGVEVVPAVGEGRSVSKVVADYAAGHAIDLVLVGASQKGKARRFLGGGEAEDIAGAVSVPVFIVKP